MGISRSLIDAVDNMDVTSIRSSFYTIILSDPEFKTDSFDNAIAYVKEHNVIGFMDENDGKVLKPENEWDEKYFDILSSELQDVFTEERIEQLKKVSKIIYAPKDIEVNEKKIDSKLEGHTVWGIIGLVIVAVLIIQYLFKEDK